MKKVDDALKILREEGKKIPSRLSVKQLKTIARESAKKEVISEHRRQK